jgi:hypothetical protein
MKLEYETPPDQHRRPPRQLPASTRPATAVAAIIVLPLISAALFVLGWRRTLFGSRPLLIAAVPLSIFLLAIVVSAYRELRSSRQKSRDQRR